MPAAEVEGLAKTEVLPTLAERLSQTEGAVRDLLYTTYEPQHVWTWFTVIGIVSMLGLVAFDQITRRDVSWEEEALIVVTGLVTGICYGWPIGLWFFGHMLVRRFTGSRAVAILVMVEIAGYVAYSVGTSLLGG